MEEGCAGQRTGLRVKAHLKGSPGGWRRGEEWGDCWRQRPPCRKVEISYRDTHQRGDEWIGPDLLQERELAGVR